MGVVKTSRLESRNGDEISSLTTLLMRAPTGRRSTALASIGRTGRALLGPNTSSHWRGFRWRCWIEIAHAKATRSLKICKIAAISRPALQSASIALEESQSVDAAFRGVETLKSSGMVPSGMVPILDHAVGEPVAYVQVLRTKGRRDRLGSVFQLPDSTGLGGRLARALAGNASRGEVE